MPSFDLTLNLHGFTITKTSGFNPLIHDLSCHAKVSCPHCFGEDLRKKDKIARQVWHESVGLRRVLLRFFICKYHCRSCGRYFRQRLERIQPWQRSTEALKKQVYRQHSQGISRKSLAANFHKSDATIARYYDHMYDLENRKLRSMQLPSILGIDEHFFSRRQRFATTFCDLKKRRVFDVAAGRSGADLADYLTHLPSKQRVRVICMDLSESYRSIARRFFPQALVILHSLPRLAANPFVIVGHRHGQHLVNIRKPWGVIRSLAGLEDVRLHDLRHSFASVGVNTGASLPMIGALLGHTQAQTTARYAHVSQSPAHQLNQDVGDLIEEAMSGKCETANEHVPLKHRDRQVYRTGELPVDIVDAIARTDPPAEAEAYNAECDPKADK